jgi:hypothetical protein
MRNNQHQIIVVNYRKKVIPILEKQLNDKIHNQHRAVIRHHKLMMNLGLEELFEKE